MSLTILIVTAVLTGVLGSPYVTDDTDVTPGTDSAGMSAHPNSVPEAADGTEVFQEVRLNLIYWCDWVIYINVYIYIYMPALSRPLTCSVVNLLNSTSIFLLFSPTAPSPTEWHCGQEKF